MSMQFIEENSFNAIFLLDKLCVNISRKQKRNSTLNQIDYSTVHTEFSSLIQNKSFSVLIAVKQRLATTNRMIFHVLNT